MSGTHGLTVADGKPLVSPLACHRHVHAQPDQGAAGEDALPAPEAVTAVAEEHGLDKGALGTVLGG